MLLPADWLFETAKLAAQLGGALLVARLAVRWALHRYKLEKSWEKRLQAYTDLVVLIGELQTVERAWLQEMEEGFEWSVEHKSELVRRYRSSWIRLEESRAMASLLLPDDTAGTIHWLFASIEQIPENISLYDMHSQTLDSVSKAMEQVVEQGRKSLGIYVDMRR